jgi:glycosyltransferase involved in cell wall biosynthesis
MMDLARALAGRGHQVTQFALWSPKQGIAPMERDPHLPPGVDLIRCPVDTRPTYIGALLKLLFSSPPYHVPRHFSRDVERSIQEHLLTEHYDIIQLESIFLWSYVPAIRRLAPRVPLIMRTQNIEHRIWHGLAAHAKGPKAWYLNIQSARIKAYETSCYASFGHILAVTDVDADWIREVAPNARVSVVGIGVDASGPAPGMKSPLSFFHLAAMNWIPNQEGVRWFIQRVWPLFISEFPDAELHLAGMGMPNDIKRFADHRVKISDGITDAVKYMADRGIMIVPLLSGSGIRVKILEGMALGKAVIATHLAAEGLAVVHDHDILLASSPEEFVAQMRRCANDPELVNRLGANAKASVVAKYSPSFVADELERHYREILA